jgi:hypothetical protein
MSYRVHSPKTLLSSVGDITIARRYYACRDCRAKRVPFDQWAGLQKEHRLTAHARRVVTLAGSTWSFDQAADRLGELCHLRTSNDVVRAVCDEEGRSAQRWLAASREPARAMAAAAGDLEFYGDGVHVNTTGGWRELRLSVFAKRPAGAAATPGQWKDRVLPEPTCRVAFAAIAASHVVGSAWQRMLGQLGLDDSPRLSVLGDGARWIWDEAAKRFKRIAAVDWCVDVFHVSEHLHGCAGKMFGVGSPGAKLWATTRTDQLIEMEGPRFIEKLRQERAAAAAAEHRKALSALIGYLSENRDSLWYRTRLAEGKPIGTGLVEGACKNTIGARLKMNNPRWRIRRAERMAALRCLQYSDLWEAYWQSKAG